jgi:hypothetical protein
MVFSLYFIASSVVSNRQKHTVFGDDCPLIFLLMEGEEKGGEVATL